jgi:2-hydroxychromene-2-carboxylate isomerase
VGAEPDSAFYYDLASPLSYLVAERVMQVLPFAAEWRGVLARELDGTGEGPATPAPLPPLDETQRALVERRARELGLMALRWPARPIDSELAMRAATYASSIGRGVPFAQAAFRQAYAAGRDLGERDWIFVAAAACEMHPAAVDRALDSRSVARALTDATGAAAARGVRAVPAIATPQGVWSGEGAPEAAAASHRPRAEPDDAGEDVAAFLLDVVPPANGSGR